MELKDEELKGGRLWLIAAGAAAIALAFTLRLVDDKLSRPPREQNLGTTLKELRTAQYSIPSRTTDPRQAPAGGENPGR